MPVHPYAGDTFVAFMDISGFSNMMSDGDRAWHVLNRFYSAGFGVLRQQTQLDRAHVEGFFISDSGILFVRATDTEAKTGSLTQLLGAVREMNVEMAKVDAMLTSSIAWGYFSYDERLQFAGIEKQALYGNAYVAAVLDNMKEAPAIQPGQCRIVRRHLPNDVVDAIERHTAGLELVCKRGDDRDRFYHYWMLNSANDVAAFERNYARAADARYREHLRLLRRSVGLEPRHRLPHSSVH